jgi:DNA-binding CsgD family transcriptional regulator
MPVKSKKYTRKNAPLPGFPWDGKFNNTAAIKKYFSHDRLQCLLCGRDFRGLGHHIIRGHNIYIDDYREQFGLPWSKGLDGKSLKELKGNVIRKTRRAGKMKFTDGATFTKRMQKYRHKKRNPPEALRKAFIDRNVKRFTLKRKREVKVYAEFLRRIKTGRTPSEVGRDKDMPVVGHFYAQLQKNPAYKKKFVAIWDKLPLKVQSRGGHFGESVKNRIVELRLKGHTQLEIGKMLGLSKASVCRLWVDIKHRSSGAKRKKIEGYEKSLLWGAEIYEEYLKRIASGRTPAEVGKDKDMPPAHSFGYHVRKNPAFRRKFEEIWGKQPFAVQVRGRRPTKSFIKALFDLRISGLSWHQMSRKLGIDHGTLQGIWFKLKKTGTKAEKKIVTDSTRKYHKEPHGSAAAMEEFLRRIRLDRTPREVSQDKDMPELAYFYYYVGRHADYERRYRKIWENLPYAGQARGKRMGDRFKHEVIRLKRRGLTNSEIGHTLGVKGNAVNAAWWRWSKNRELKKGIVA